MAPTTPLGKKSTTSPVRPQRAGTKAIPLHVCETAQYARSAGLHRARLRWATTSRSWHAGQGDPPRRRKPGEGPGILFRGSALALPHHLENASRWTRSASCAKRWPTSSAVAICRDRTKEAAAASRGRRSARACEDLPRLLGLVNGATSITAQPPSPPQRTRPAHQGGRLRRPGRADARRGAGGSGAGGRLRSLLAALLRPGDALGHLQLPRAALAVSPIDSPLVSRPNVLLALNEPSLRKFLPARRSRAASCCTTATELPADCVRPDVRMVALPFTRLADESGRRQSRQHRDARARCWKPPACWSRIAWWAPSSGSSVRVSSTSISPPWPVAARSSARAPRTTTSGESEPYFA